ncbi:MAG: hypothetical protein KJZ86_13715 [Caldilineaceae bacterium]|nr:hypothetical protein [Caldilineaceae bacterium]HRJ40769.1 hypothetical protein [Caldilineaceae bacterium]
MDEDREMEKLLEDFGRLSADKRKEIIQATAAYILLYPYMEGRGQAGQGVTIEHTPRQMLTDGSATAL